MVSKPLPEEFDITRDGMRHAPTQALFVPRPGHPTIGTWSDGHGKPKNGIYDLKEVHELGRKLWAKYLVKTKS
jgi:hypothetical protein